MVGKTELFDDFDGETFLQRKPKFYFRSTIRLSIVKSFYINALFVEIKFKDIDELVVIMVVLSSLTVKS